ncbi:MAG: ATP-binding protein [Bacteroidales bacterium]|jgi:serine/threonine-protein kinase RsbW|nr:ATP-binding protein [Bacteroidales bacterium]
MQIVLRSNYESLSKLTHTIDSLLDTLRVSDGVHVNVIVSLIEAVKNAIEHGNKLDEKRTISIDYKATPEYLEFQVTDSGEGFEQERVPDPTAPENIAKEGGRGVFLMKKLASQCEYNEKGNAVRLRFDLK